MRFIFILTLFLIVFLQWTIAAPKKTAKERNQAKLLEDQEAESLIYSLQNSLFDQDCIWFCELELFPYRGEKSSYDCIYYGSDSNKKVRLILLPNKNLQNRSEYLFHIGKESFIWDFSNGSALPVPETHWTQELIPNVNITPFDLLRPFVYWSKFEYLGPSQLKSRPVQTFKMYRPKNKNTNTPNIVEIAIDDDFKYPVEFNFYKNNQRLKRWKMLNIKKIQNNWIPKIIDITDELARNKVRFRVKEAAMNLKLPVFMFQPEQMTREIPLIKSMAFDKL